MARSPDQSVTYFPLRGGLDLLSPAIVAKQGTAQNALNYESAATGYRRMDGFERFNGREAPSDAAFYLLNFDAGVGAINAGDTVTGLTSGATGKALANAVVESGTYGGSNAIGYVPVGAMTGAFIDNEALRVGGVTKATMNGVALLGDSRTDAEAVAWQATASANARALIAAVPGSGPVRGVWKFNGTVYAFRNNVGGTAGTMWRSTVTGWVQVTFGRRLGFTSGGVYVVKEGDTITGATSGATAIVRRVVLQGGGNFSAGTQAGYLVIDTQTGTFVAENLNVGANLDVATIAGNSTAITLPAGGRYNCITENFYGTVSGSRMFFANGVGFAHEFDGATLVPIETGMATDTPAYIAEHNGALLLTFPGGSLQASVVGEPLDWRGQLGAVEIGMGSEITGLLPNIGGATMVFCQTKVGALFGNDSNDYQLQTLSDESGGVAHTAQRIGGALYMDARHIRNAKTTDSFANFNIGAVTELVAGLIQNYLKRGSKPTASLRVRAKDQYRIFFDDTTGFTIYFGTKQPETMPFQLPIQVRCACSIEQNGTEELYAGADDGFVYRLDKGNNFDGAAVPYYLRLPYNHLGAPRMRKRWFKAIIECEVAPAATLVLSADFDYGSGEDPGIVSSTFDIRGGGGNWNLANWNEFYWSSPQEGEATAYLDGVSRNMSLLFAGEAADEPPHLLQGVTIYYAPRGLER